MKVDQPFHLLKVRNDYLRKVFCILLYEFTNILYAFLKKIHKHVNVKYKRLNA